MKRREFLGASLAASIALTRFQSAFGIDDDNRYRKQMGLQLYTLRTPLSRDLDKTIKAVADAGYFQVEPFGFPAADAILKSAADHGLQCRSTHFDPSSIINPDSKTATPFGEIVEKASNVGLTHLVIPFLPPSARQNLDDYRKLAQHCNQAAEVAKSAGIELSYHNHAFEFEPQERGKQARGKQDRGKTGYDVFIEEFSEDMKFEVDVFWVQVGGEDIVGLIRKLNDRVTQLHLKDLNAAVETPNYGSIPTSAFEELGDGVIPMEPILAAAEEVGIKYCHVEQDFSPNPIESVQQSMDHLKSL